MLSKVQRFCRKNWIFLLYQTFKKSSYKNVRDCRYRLEEWESAAEYDAGIYDTTLAGEIKLTDEGKRVLEELEKRLLISPRGVN